MRVLTTKEQQRLSLLTSQSVSVALLEPTTTGLEKSIMDATALVRNFLIEAELHDYSYQKQGPNHKAIIKSYFLTDNVIIPSQASLYRPQTKKGDPRIWFKGLPNYARAGNILALFMLREELYVINLTVIDLEEVLLRKKSGPIWDIISEVTRKELGVSSELLAKLRRIARKGPACSVMEKKADTAVGRTLETLLGIKINSSKTPDYKGIELKSYRSKKGVQNRKNLFAQVPNWGLSKFKSSDEILNNFGYLRNGILRLNCTVSTRVRNSQGLALKVDQDLGRLFENSDNKAIDNFVTWVMADLKKRLLEKHAETFWIEADSTKVGNQEFFHFRKVLHTRKPIASQFDILLEQGAITMDHLIKKNKTGKAHEKGPLFKIKPASLEMLFPPSKTYVL